MLDELGEAFDRFDDFLAVQHVGRVLRKQDQMVDALHCLQESVGIEEHERRLLRERIKAIESVAGHGGTQGEIHTGAVVLGLLLGLMDGQPSHGRGPTA